MGLFGKKEKVACPICGGEVTGLFKTKIAGKQELCQECAHIISMPKDMVKNADVAAVKANLAYREKQVALYRTMNANHKFQYGTFLYVEADEEKQLISFTCSAMNCDQEKPMVLHYDQLKSYELWLERSKLDDSAAEGEIASMSMTGVLSNALGNSSRDMYYHLKMKTTDPYWPEIDIDTALVQHPQFSGYKDNMHGIASLVKSITRKAPFVMHY